MKYQITMVPSFLYSIGVPYYQTGTVSMGKDKVFDFYKCDGITEEQRAAIVAWCPFFQTMGAACGYAPEIKSKLLCFPKAAFFRIMKGSDRTADLMAPGARL